MRFVEEEPGLNPTPRPALTFPHRRRYCFRVKLWSKFVAVAKEMLRMGNFHDSMGITITLTATIALLRLKVGSWAWA